MGAATVIMFVYRWKLKYIYQETSDFCTKLVLSILQATRKRQNIRNWNLYESARLIFKFARLAAIFDKNNGGANPPSPHCSQVNVGNFAFAKMMCGCAYKFQVLGVRTVLAITII